MVFHAEVDAMRKKQSGASAAYGSLIDRARAVDRHLVAFSTMTKQVVSAKPFQWE